MFNQEKGGPKKKKADAGWFDSHEQVSAEKYDQGNGELTVGFPRFLLSFILSFHSSLLSTTKKKKKKKIWIVRDSKLVPLTDKLVKGIFFSSETYVLRYVWVYKEKKRGIFYVWQGRSCLGNKKGAGWCFIFVVFYF
jgi:hypothetical protein